MRLDARRLARARRPHRHSAAGPGLLGGLAALCLGVLLVLPVVALVWSALGGIGAGLRDPSATAALALSLETTAWSLTLTLLGGTPLAWWLAGAGEGVGATVRRVAEAALRLPMVLPPAVAGLALLLTFGRMGLVGPWLEARGWAIPFSTTAVVLAQVFVAAPFYVTAATEAFRGVDPRLPDAARSLGCSPRGAFWRVALPLAWPGLVAGAAASWARALGEFGATLLFAGNLPERTQTLPLAIYAALESDLAVAQAIAVALVVVAFGVLGLLELAARRAEP